MNISYSKGFALIWLIWSVNGFAQGLTFQDALNIALQQAPILMVNQAQTDAARSAAIPAGALPDPQLALGIDNLPIQGADGFSLSRDFMTMQRVGLMQAFPNMAKLDARVSAAEGKVALAEAQTRLVKLQVMQETAVAWIARSAIERQLRLMTELEQENKLFDQAVRARFAGGKGMASDTLMPRQEAAAIAERRDELDARHSQALAQLTRWLGEAAERELIGEIPDWPISQDSLAHGLHRHPELDLFMPKKQVLDAEVAEAKAEKIPDWAVQLAYQKRGAAYSDMVSLQVSVDLPLFSGSRQQPKLEAKMSERMALNAEHAVALREHTAMLNSDLAEYQRLLNAEQRTLEVLLPLAEEKVSLTLAAWRSNQTDLSSLVSARKERLETRLKAIALKADRQQLAARLHYTYSQDTLNDAELQP